MTPISHPIEYAAGLDVGSNTFSCVLLKKQGSVVTVEQDVSYPVRLSENLHQGQPLDPAALERSLKQLEQLVIEFRLSRPVPRRAVATEVLRIAANPEAFTKSAGDIFGAPIEVISGNEEARLTAKGALLGLDAVTDALIVDVGGQSTELGRLERSGLSTVSLPLGVVGLFEAHQPPDHWSDAAEAAIRHDVRAELASVPEFHSGQQLIAVAGTATTLAMLDAKLTHWDRDRVHGFGITAERLGHWLQQMLALTPAERTTKFGIDQRRADVFPVGLIILQELARAGGHHKFTISANGLRVGAALSLWELT